MILYVASTAVLAPYVKKVTKDQSQAMDNFRLTIGLNLMAFICMWSMWIMAYMHQMYQLQKPAVTDWVKFHSEASADVVAE